MNQHFGHLLLMLVISAMAMVVLIRNHWSGLSLRLVTVVVLGLFMLSFVAPCHLLASAKNIAQTPMGTHACCLIQTAAAMPTFQFEIDGQVVVSSFQLAVASNYFLVIERLDNKSPPIFG